jgi:predicted dehydrogenase
MKLALIGCGAVALKHAQAIAEAAAVRIEWVMDPRPEAAKNIASRYAPHAKVASGFAEIPLAEVDGLVICSPTAEHHAQVSAALRAGKHVLCEKPLAATSAQIRELISLRDTTDSVLAVAFQRRTEAPYVTVRKLIAERASDFGYLKTMHLYVCERWSQTIEGTWRNDPRLGFGYFGDAGVHQIDSIAFMTGCAPQNVQAHGDRRGRNVEIVTDIRSQWISPDGRAVSMTAQFVGDANHWREDIALHFENADVLMRSGEIQICRDNQRAQIITETTLGSTPVADFLAACRGQQETVAPAECGLVSALWTEAVLASIPNCQAIELARM